MSGSFRDLGISEELEAILNKNGITEPTVIQEKTIRELLNGRDVVAQAQTGTGKTLAFLLPIIQKIDINKLYIQGLIITPTRELAIQVTNEAKKLMGEKEINILAAYGGQDVEQQVRKLKNGIHLVIATPGRLLDHIRRETIDFGRVNFLVLDEADEMLNMGFLKDVESIIVNTPKTRQTMLFSATIPNEIRSLGKRFMRNPLQVEIQGKNITLDEIEQVIIETTERKKLDILCQLIDEYNPYLAIVFCRTKQGVIALNGELLSRGYNSDELHGDLSQAKRERVIKSFRTAKIQILVATDIVARGLDVEGVTHVINYDIPRNVDSYIHRIGRTGRIGNLGTAITFVTERDRDDLALIQRKVKADLKTRKVEKNGRKDVKKPDNKPEKKKTISKEYKFERTKGSGPRYAFKNKKNSKKK